MFCGQCFTGDLAVATALEEGGSTHMHMGGVAYDRWFCEIHGLVALIPATVVR